MDKIINNIAEITIQFEDILNHENLKIIINMRLKDEHLQNYNYFTNIINEYKNKLSFDVFNNLIKKIFLLNSNELNIDNIELKNKDECLNYLLFFVNNYNKKMKDSSMILCLNIIFDFYKI
tara:strand:- start:83 stop:445 length:363 start_codon:yes stop_codon:yes gene_type:complete